MAIVSDDYNVVDAAKVASVTKPDASDLWWLLVYLDANPTPVTTRFVSTDARDEFYKRLIDAMGQG